MKKLVPSLGDYTVGRVESGDETKHIRVGLLNLMPSVVVERTERQFAHFLANAPHNVEYVPFYFDAHKSHSKQSYFDQFAETIADVKAHGLDGLISTGANLEHIPFEEVEYWEEFLSFLDWVHEHVGSTIYSCWSAHAALRHYHKIEPTMNKTKQFGVFLHTVNHLSGSRFIEGMDSEVTIPHSRWRGEERAKVEACTDLRILIDSAEVGPHCIVGREGREIYVQGHPEYDSGDIAAEYFRDKEKGIAINVPAHYFPHDDDTQLPQNTWGAQGQIFYNNWVRFLHEARS